MEIVPSGCRGWSRSEIDHLREQSVINGSPQIRGALALSGNVLMELTHTQQDQWMAKTCMCVC